MLIRVYVRDPNAPFVDWLGRHHRPEDESELIELVRTLRQSDIVEIVIQGTPSKPFTRIQSKLGLQFVRLGRAWGMRSASVFLCRGRRVEQVVSISRALSEG